MSTHPAMNGIPSVSPSIGASGEEDLGGCHGGIDVINSRLAERGGEHQM
jgi:hypothetical protein